MMVEYRFNGPIGWSALDFGIVATYRTCSLGCFGKGVDVQSGVHRQGATCSIDSMERLK